MDKDVLNLIGFRQPAHLALQIIDGYPYFDNSLDLRFLQGDRGSSDSMSQLVSGILDHHKKSTHTQFSSASLLAGPSGVGKTKAMFDIARKNWLFILIVRVTNKLM